MKTGLLAGLLATSMTLSGCSMLDIKSLQTDNLIKTAAVTTAAYATGGALPAVVVAATAVGVDTVLPDDKPAISDIEAGNEEQLRAFMFANITETILYGIIGFLIFTNVVGPWAAQRRAKRKAEAAAEDKRRKEKYDAMKAELAAQRKS